jgi:2-polyprenyl-3-methyl-5-hydroxy-6-metoxy-1,4-benzoquinol methylase
MDQKARVDKIAALANVESYDSDKTRRYTNGAPHIKHAKLRSLYNRLIVEIYATACSFVSQPKVLDLGAGEGSATLPFLELGAAVTAVDISEAQLDVLRVRCSSFDDDLSMYRGDIHDAISEYLDHKCQYDIIVANSFLHHVPDYLGLIRECSKILSPHGQFFSFQDPMRYASLGTLTSLFTKVSYFSWRILQEIWSAVYNAVSGEARVFTLTTALKTIQNIMLCVVVWIRTRLPNYSRS